MHYINFHIFLSCSSQYYNTCAFNQLISLHTLYEYLKPATAGTAYYVLPLRTLTLPGTYHCRHDSVSPRVFALHKSIHILSLLLATTTKTVAMYSLRSKEVAGFRASIITPFAITSERGRRRPVTKPREATQARQNLSN